MDFKETYKKYLDGTATDEEKAFVEAEIEKAKLVNNEIITNIKPDAVKAEAKVKAKKKKSLRQTIKTIIICIVVFIIISLVAFGTVYGLSIPKAIDNIKVQPEEAKEAALEYTYMYARDHFGYTGSMEMLVSDQEPDSRELEFRFPLNKCYYVYEFEFIAGDREFDVHVNSTTGMPYFADIDIID